MTEGTRKEAEREWSQTLDSLDPRLESSSSTRMTPWEDEPNWVPRRNDIVLQRKLIHRCRKTIRALENRKVSLEDELVQRRTRIRRSVDKERELREVRQNKADLARSLKIQVQGVDCEIKTLIGLTEVSPPQEVSTPLVQTTPSRVSWGSVRLVKSHDASVQVDGFLHQPEDSGVSFKFVTVVKALNVFLDSVASGNAASSVEAVESS